MRDVLLGVLAILVGAAFCFRGYLTMRVVLPLWGGFVGFLVGAGLVASATGDGFLEGVLAVVVGVVVALLFAWLAYAYYAVSVVLGVASIGFLVGASLLVALGVEWNWVVVLGGVVVGTAFAALAIVGNLPMMLLTLLTAIGGSIAIVGGLMLLTGAIESADFDQRSVVARIDDSLWWWLLFVVLAAAGVVAQLRAVDTARRDLRAYWAAGDRRVAGA